MSTIRNNKKYQAFLNLPDRSREPIEMQFLTTFAGFYNSGYSTAVSIVKTSRTLNRSRGLVENVIRNNAQMASALSANRKFVRGWVK